MKILHTSDWHLGISIHNVPLISEQRDFVACLCRTVAERKIDAVLIAGDIFDNTVSSSEAISVYNEAVTELCLNIGVTVVISAGNHDGASRLSSCSRLLKKAGLHIYGRLSQYTEPVSLGDVDIYPLPYFNMEEVKSQWPGAKFRDYGEAFSVVTSQLRNTMNPDRKNIVMAHCFVGGSLLCESDRAAMLGGATVVPLNAFDGFDYVALGHLHRPQPAGGPLIRYSGSPLKYSFGESGTNKTFSLIDTETMSVEEVPIVPLRDMRVITGTYDHIVEQAFADDNRDDYIKISLSDKYAGIETMDSLRKLYPNLLSLAGISSDGGTGITKVTADELSSMTPEMLLDQFCHDVMGSEPTQRQRKWFADALRESEEGGDIQ